MKTRARSIKYNSGFSLLDKAYTSISGLLLVPFVVQHIGVEAYGAWVLLTVVTSYFSLLQWGVPSSFEKYIAEFSASSDPGALQKFIVTAFYSMLAVGTACYLLSAVLAQPILQFLLKSNWSQCHPTVFLLLMLVTALSFPASILSAVPRGVQRFDVGSIISILARTCYIAVVIALIVNGHGLMGLVIAQFAMLACSSALLFTYATVAIPSFSLHPRHFSTEHLRAMFSFGSRIQVSFFAGWVVQNFDKLLIGRLFGVNLVAAYDLGARLVLVLKDIPSFLFAVITPRASELSARADLPEVRRLYLRGTAFTAAASLAANPILLPCAAEILGYWLRREIDPLSTYVFGVLLVSLMFNVTAGVGTSIAVGMGRIGDVARANVAMAAVNILGSVAFGFLWGANGVVWGSALGLLVNTVVFYAYLNRTLQLSNAGFWRRVMLLPVAASLLLTCVTSMHGQVGHRLANGLHSLTGTTLGREAVLLHLAANTVVVAVCCIAVFLRLRYFKVEDAQEPLSAPRDKHRDKQSVC